MKKILLSIITLILAININAQSPESFKYQAIVRDASGNAITDQSIGMQINIRQTTATGTIIYGETFTQNSNAFGLVNLEIGTGTATTGTFSSIDWSNGPYFIEISMDPTGGTSYTVTGSSQLLSVPYALYAESAGNAPWSEFAQGIFYNGGNVAIGAGATLENNSRMAILHNNSSGAVNILKLKNQNAAGVTRLNIATDLNTQLILGVNNSTSSFGPSEAFLWYFGNFDMKFATNSTERLRIKNTGNIEVKTGDVYIENIGSGVILRSPDGNCWRMTVSDAGAQVITSITCP